MDDDGHRPPLGTVRTARCHGGPNSCGVMGCFAATTALAADFQKRASCGVKKKGPFFLGVKSQEVVDLFQSLVRFS